jgi:hypothetical protein
MDILRVTFYACGESTQAERHGCSQESKDTSSAILCFIIQCGRGSIESNDQRMDRQTGRDRESDI